MGRRLTRKEIVQEDKIHATLSTIYGWSTLHTKWLVGTALLFLAGAVGIFFWRNYQESRRTEVQREFAEALEIHHAPVAGESSGSSDTQSRESRQRFQSAQERHQKALARFEAIAGKYSSMSLGVLARYYVALNQRQLGRVKEAMETLRWVIEHAHDADIKNLARNALAQQALLENNREEAIKLLKEIAETSRLFPRPNVLLQLAQSYEARGNVEEAIKQYRKISSDYPASEQAREAQSKIAELEALQKSSK